MRIAGCHDFERFDEPVIHATPQSYQEGLALFVETARRITGESAVSSIAVGVPGVVTSDKQSIINTPNLPDWSGKDLARDLSSQLGARAFLDNDVVFVGLGEAVYGAGVGASIVVYITVSTGINGVRVVDGAVEKAAVGFEIGGQYLSIGEQPETFEDMVSGSAIARKYGVHPRDLGADSPVWEELAHITAFAVHNTVLHWSPQRVVLGGSMFKEIGIAPERVEAHLKTIMKKFPMTPEVVHSSLGDLGGLWGAMAFLKGSSTN